LASMATGRTTRSWSRSKRREVCWWRVFGAPAERSMPSIRYRLLGYRERHTVVRAKSDRVDAELLANILRTDRTAHRPLPADSELAQAIGVLARAQQDAVWNRQHIANQLRSFAA